MILMEQYTGDPNLRRKGVIRETVASRLNEIRRLLSIFTPKPDIIDRFSREWGIGKGAVKNYVNHAINRNLASLDGEPDEHLGNALDWWRERVIEARRIAEDSTRSDDERRSARAEANAAKREIDRLCGVARPSRIAAQQVDIRGSISHQHAHLHGHVALDGLSVEAIVAECEKIGFTPGLSLRGAIQQRLTSQEVDTPQANTSRVVINHSSNGNGNGHSENGNGSNGKSHLPSVIPANGVSGNGHASPGSYAGSGHKNGQNTNGKSSSPSVNAGNPAASSPASNGGHAGENGSANHAGNGSGNGSGKPKSNKGKVLATDYKLLLDGQLPPGEYRRRQERAAESLRDQGREDEIIPNRPIPAIDGVPLTKEQLLPAAERKRLEQERAARLAEEIQLSGVNPPVKKKPGGPPKDPNKPIDRSPKSFGQNQVKAKTGTAKWIEPCGPTTAHAAESSTPSVMPPEGTPEASGDPLASDPASVLTQRVRRENARRAAEEKAAEEIAALIEITLD